MKIIKNLVYVVGLIIFVLIFVNVLQNIGPFNFVGDNYAGNSFRPLKWYKINNLINIKTYGFKKPSSKNAIIIDFSDNDIRYNDSIIKIISKTDAYIDDNIKEWKKSHLIYMKKRYKIKYKFHGSHNYNYKQGKISLKVKSKKNISEAKQFSLISGFQEASFINIFLALQEHEQKLIAPDPGTILLANINGKVEDYWLTEDLSDNYLKEKYNLEDYIIFKVSDNWNRNGGPHYSELDGFYYYLDGDNLEGNSEKYKKYKNFITGIQDHKKGQIFKNTDYKYMGRFLANLYFYYGVHHIQGDNNKYLYDYKKNIVYPVARNEGVYEKIQNVLKLDQEIFNTRKSPTTTFYKKAVCNDSIKYYRDIELYKMVRNKKKTLKQLDSLNNLFNKYHKYYNQAYMNVRYKYKKIQEIVNHNSNALERYLNNGEVIISYNKRKNTINIATDYRVPLKVVDIKNMESFIFKGVDFKYKEGEVKTNIVEKQYTFKNTITKNQLKIVNLITKDTISNNNIIFNYF